MILVTTTIREATVNCSRSGPFLGYTQCIKLMSPKGPERQFVLFENFINLCSSDVSNDIFLKERD